MFFDTESLAFTILDVLDVSQENVSNYNKERNFCALSFRFEADTVLKTEAEEYKAETNCVCYVPAQLNYSRVSKRDRMIVVHFHALNYSGSRIEVFYPETPESLGQLFLALLDSWNAQTPGYVYQCSAILNEILASCYRQNYKKTAPDKIQNALRYLEENYRKSDLTIAEIAEQAFISEVYFRKLFKQQCGISPRKYIIKLRMQTAMELIATGYYSLQEIAEMVGYRDYKYFSVEFKAFTGVSPSKYFYHFPN